MPPSSFASRLDDTVTGFGSDTMDFALEGHAQIELSGGAQGVDELRHALSGAGRGTAERPPRRLPNKERDEVRFVPMT